jgi:formylglycine-generating enzyme required for sulfatase activity
MIFGLVGWINESYIAERVKYVWTVRPFLAANMWPYALTPAAEQALKPDPNNSFRECAPKQQDKDYCPDMIVVPAGSFKMGLPPTEFGYTSELPQHSVTIAKPFAVSKFELTFDEWDTCVNYGDCPENVSDFGRGQQPVTNVTWDDAQRYVAWLSKTTGKTYRLLSEAEYEYATRAGTTTAYPWGNHIGKNNANCQECGSQWDNEQTAPVGSFAGNGFGLYDMVGNVWGWAQDCYHHSYEVETPQGKVYAPADGTEWTTACRDARTRVVRGGSWGDVPDGLRSANRTWNTTGYHSYALGIRVGRTLSAGAGAIKVAPGVR